MAGTPKEQMSREELLEYIRRMEADRYLSPMQMMSEGYRILFEEAKAHNKQQPEQEAFKLKEDEDPDCPLDMIKRAYKIAEEK